MEKNLTKIIEEAKSLKILKIDVPEIEKKEHILYLNKSKLEVYKQISNEKCSKCIRQPKYINKELNELLCWNHSII